MGYDLLADLIVAVHFAYVAFVLVGQIAIVIGFGLKSSWIRNFWFRLAHLLAILIVGLEALFQIDCSLTVWEGRLRQLAGQEAAQGSFVGRCLDYVIFYNVETRVLNLIHIGFALLVLATLLLIPPRRPWRRDQTPPTKHSPRSHATSNTAAD